MKNVGLWDIKINSEFLQHSPANWKFNWAKEYIEEYGKIDKLITLKDGVLVDGYTRYMVAYIKGLKEVPCIEQGETMYIVGKFYGNDKGYTWKNNNKFNIAIGDKVIVSTKGKNNNKRKAVVTVVDIFTSDDKELYIKHKSVINLLD